MNVSIDDPDYKTKVIDIIREHGVVIINNVFSNEECDESMDELFESMSKLSGNVIKRKNWKTEWNRQNLPPQTRIGLFQSLVGNFPQVWKLRSDPRMNKIFTEIYSDLRGKAVTDFSVAIDGINIKSPTAPYCTDKTADWAHLDMTQRDAKFSCVQGQIVLTNTSACFRCSPGSHEVYGQVLDKLGVSRTDKSNWCKFKKSDYTTVKKIVEDAGGQWQIPIRAPKGSVILWLSSLIHSAKAQDNPKSRIRTECPPIKDDFWDEWRGVVYCCYRPKVEMPLCISRLQRCFRENRVTNHWSGRMFPVKPQYYNPDKFNDTLRELIMDPCKAYEIEGLKPEITPEMTSLFDLPQSKPKIQPKFKIKPIHVKLKPKLKTKIVVRS